MQIMNWTRRTSQRRAHGPLLGVALAALGLLVTGCGSSSDDDDTVTPPGTSTQGNLRGVVLSPDYEPVPDLEVTLVDGAGQQIGDLATTTNAMGG